MLQRISNFISNNRRFIPMMATAILAFLAYGVGSIYFEGMRNPQVFLNLFRNSSFLLISAIGMTFVILTGGIDLSVSGVVVLTTVISAALLRDGMNPWLVILVVISVGMALGLIMGSFIVYLKVQPFIATLAGMWFARGLCFFISDNAINIDERTFTILGQTRILIPGLKELADAQGTQPPYISIPVVVGFIVLFGSIYMAHFTRFGRTVYAIGGNEQSARLMGLPVNRTLLLVYTFNGLCSALAGLAFCLFVSSGHGLYAPGFELDVIASVVIGGTLLTGGSGYVVGTFFGVMVLAITQALIQFIGSLSSWWTKIVIGVLMLVFIGVQALLANRKGGPRQAEDPMIVRRQRQRLALGIGAFVVVVGLAIVIVPRYLASSPEATTEAEQCEVKPFRKDEAAGLLDDGAVIAYHRQAGPNCVDEMYAIYPDGRVVGDNGVTQVEAQVSPEEVMRILTTISEEYDWFTDEIYDTYLTPCRQCYTHYVLVSYNGQEKGATTTDGTTAMPSEYGFTLSVIRPLLPEIPLP
jgi:ribose/xylose/arabinose/galactoside ABC-type transport system permease subunit